MSKKSSPGLYFNQNKSCYYINKQIDGKRYHFSTQSKSRAGAERFLATWLKSINSNQHETVLTFRDAAIQFLLTSARKDLNNDASRLTKVYPFIADLQLDLIDGVVISKLQAHLQALGRKSNTINATLSLVRLILNQCAQSWKTESGDFWLKHVPKFRTIRVTDERLPYPLSWPEQSLILPHLPHHLVDPINFILQTGLRNREVSGLRWSDLRRLPDSNIEYFLIPASRMKNGKPRLVVLNHIAKRIIDELKNTSNSDHVFLYLGLPMSSLNNDGWKTAVKKASEQYQNRFGGPCPIEFFRLRIHDMRHTFGRRLRSTGMNDADMATLLGHSHQNSITGHYTDVDVHHLHQLLEKIADRPSIESTPMLRLVNDFQPQNSAAY